jgi:hypothetical protein
LVTQDALVVTARETDFNWVADEAVVLNVLEVASGTAEPFMLHW